MLKLWVGLEIGVGLVSIVCLGAGCFWGVQYHLEKLEGVKSKFWR